AINAHEREPRIYLDGLRDALDRRVKLVPLITHHWSLDRIGEAFCCADERPAGFVKGIVEP
ncbi:MAG TPA: L-iditol 2-dehydrogenase, partial [Chloroflexota bacterium]|nr:L-iditol 2-dehydrogenase [Chloroflexota bacterium]